jgi:hypothetical protein
MPFYFFVWDNATIQHLAEHDVTPDQFESIICDPESVGVSCSTGRPAASGVADDGRLILCVYEFLDDSTILPITAFEVE